MTLIEAEKSPPKFRRNRAAREQSLIEAALVEFSEKGFDAATTKEIARRAECSEALITNYFGSKEGLLLAIMNNRLEAAEREISSPATARENLEDEIREYVLARTVSIRNDAPFNKIQWSRMLIDPSFSRFHLSTRDEHRLRPIADRLRRHARAGRVAPNVDLDAAAVLIGAVCNYLGLVCGVVYGFDEDYISKHATLWAEMLARGLAPPPNNKSARHTRKEVSGGAPGA